MWVDCIQKTFQSVKTKNATLNKKEANQQETEQKDDTFPAGKHKEERLDYPD